MTKKKTEKPNPTILLLFVGRCTLSDGKTEGRVFYRIEEDELEGGNDAFLDDESVIAGRRVVLGGRGLNAHMGGNPGIVYRVEQPPDDDTSYFIATARYAGRWENQEQCAAWQMADSAKGQQIALMKDHKRAKRQDDVLECLAPIREAYKKARGLQRNLILARAVQYITRG